MGFETPPEVGAEKYYPGFNPAWLEDKEFLDKARKLADFYREQLASLKIEAPDDEEILIHFTPSVALDNVQSAGRINNSSRFYDGGREKLTEQGFDFTKADATFGDPECVVSIPWRSFAKWTSTLSWLKLMHAGVLDNAIVLSAPKKDIILRNGNFVEAMFQSNVDQAGEEALDTDRLKYFNSTSPYSEELLADNQIMWEAWVPHALSLANSQTITYQENKN